MSMVGRIDVIKCTLKKVISKFNLGARRILTHLTYLYMHGIIMLGIIEAPTVLVLWWDRLNRGLPGPTPDCRDAAETSFHGSSSAYPAAKRSLLCRTLAGP